MIDGTDYVQALMDTLSEHDRAIAMMRDDGRAYAEAERDYRIALRVEIMRLRDEGMPATITPDLARGEPKVAAVRPRPRQGRVGGRPLELRAPEEPGVDSRAPDRA